MTVLGKPTKQPVEVEVYSIQFIEDLAPTDELTSTWQILARSTATAWDGIPLTANYTATASDSGRIIVTDHGITLPTQTDGYVLYVSNKSQLSAISVGSFSVPARGALVVSGVGGAWVAEASTMSVLIDAPGDQRVRTFVTGGKVGLSYKLQVAVTTSEGRTLQDELLIRIKEY